MSSTATQRGDRNYYTYSGGALQQSFRNIHEELSMSTQLKKDMIRKTRAKERTITLQLEELSPYRPPEQLPSRSRTNSTLEKFDTFEKFNNLKTMKRINTRTESTFNFAQRV